MSVAEDMTDRDEHGRPVFRAMAGETVERAAARVLGGTVRWLIPDVVIEHNGKRYGVRIVTSDCVGVVAPMNESG